jgi:hypothetical protein
MLIGAFVSLLQKKYGIDASAYVPTVYGKGTRKQSVSVVYGKGQKVYTYNGTILAIAEKLDLIPSINVVDESADIVSKITSGQSVIGHVCASDTVRFDLPEGLYMVQSNYGTDEYDRDTCEYSATNEKSPWLM